MLHLVITIQLIVSIQKLLPKGIDTQWKNRWVMGKLHWHLKEDTGEGGALWFCKTFLDTVFVLCCSFKWFCFDEPLDILFWNSWLKPVVNVLPEKDKVNMSMLSVIHFDRRKLFTPPHHVLPLTPSSLEVLPSLLSLWGSHSSKMPQLFSKDVIYSF